MKKKTLILLSALLVTVLLVTGTAVASRQEDPGASKCTLDITFDDHGDGMYWLGSLSGPDCSVAGTIRFDGLRNEYRDAGKTRHFVEAFTIWPGSNEQSGDYIRGKNCGVWNLTTFRYRARGWVTDVSSDQWAHLVGAQYHEKGVTGDPAGALPLEAPGGHATLAPGARPVGAPEDLCAPPE